MQYNLVPHPATRPRSPSFDVWARVESGHLSGKAATTFIFGVSAPAARFVIPTAPRPRRADNLWQTTCFEAFLGHENDRSYREWNFAPSGEWASYDFSGYREQMQPAEVRDAPRIRSEDHRRWWTVGATIGGDRANYRRLALSAVLEERDGTLSYWAIRHPLSDRPDFHHPGSFTHV